METFHVLIIDDDPIVARTIERSLKREGFRITVSCCGSEGLASARRSTPNLVILDVLMPGEDGYEVCREMRADPVLEDVPVLFLTARIRSEDKITGFRAGADDYLCKPFNVDELILRVRAILRRAGYPLPEEALPGNGPAVVTTLDKPAEASRADKGTIVIEDHALDPRSFEIETPHGGKVRLTPIQFDLLYHLMSHPGELFAPDRLLDEVWDYPAEKGSPDLVRVHIKTLRQRIELQPEAPAFIRTVPGYGYIVGPKHERERL